MRLGNTLVIGEFQTKIPDDDLTAIAEEGWVTPHDRHDVPERPVWRIDMPYGLGVIVCVDAPSEINDMLHREWERKVDEMPS